MRSNLGTVIAIACALFIATCKRTASEEHADATATGAVVPTRGVVRVSGSSALLPLLNVAKESFEEAHPGMSVEVSAGGSQKSWRHRQTVTSAHLSTADIIVGARRSRPKVATGSTK